MINSNKLQPEYNSEYTGHEQLLKEYAHLFDGIGTLNNFEVKVHIDEHVPPVAKSPRRIPFHMRQKVSEALDQLGRDGIIEKVVDATPWVSPLVVIPTKDGDVRLWVDMRLPNQAIQCERIQKRIRLLSVHDSFQLYIFLKQFFALEVYDLNKLCSSLVCNLLLSLLI